MMEVDEMMDIGREQRKAEAKAKQGSWQERVICKSLASEICSGVSQKSVVRTFMNTLMEDVWMESQAREAWRLIMDSQQVQMKVLGLIEEQERKVAEVAKEERRKERLSRNEKLRKYWEGKREEARLEAVRG